MSTSPGSALAFFPPRWLPLAGVAFFLGVGVGLRSVLHRLWYGGSGIVVVGGQRAGRSFVERCAPLLPALLVGQAALACTPAGAAALCSLAPPDLRAPLAATGFAVVLVATAAMLAAQLDMGASWRIGIDRRAAPGLVTRGLYRWSRNPIYACMFGALGGFVLLLPGWPALVTAIAAVLGIRAAVADEEAYLERVYGEAYRAYASRVGRFVPGVGKLPARSS